jgi:23S rRNA pseudouridine1911/1915/1917 synthase
MRQVDERQGVVPAQARTEWTVDKEHAGQRLDRYLAAQERLGSRRRASIALERGRVFVNGAEATLAQAGSRLTDGDVVRLWMGRPGSAKRRYRPMDLGKLRVLYQDDSLLVVNKPAGLLVVPLERRRGAENVYDSLQEHFRGRGRRQAFVVHRIDRDTSGLVLFAKDAQTRDRLKEQFTRREPERVYWAVVYGSPDPAAGTWRDRLVWDRKALVQKAARPTDPAGSDAISEYRVLERFRGSSLLEVRLRTGRRNQIRLQAQLHGCPIVGERRYVSDGTGAPPIAFSRQALHARRLAFRHPADGRLLGFEAPLPPDLAELVKRLRRT